MDAALLQPDGKTLVAHPAWPTSAPAGRPTSTASRTRSRDGRRRPGAGRLRAASLTLASAVLGLAVWVGLSNDIPDMRGNAAFTAVSNRTFVPGTYTSTLTLRPSGQAPVEAPLTLTVS